MRQHCSHHLRIALALVEAAITIRRTGQYHSLYGGVGLQGRYKRVVCSLLLLNGGLSIAVRVPAHIGTAYCSRVNNGNLS